MNDLAAALAPFDEAALTALTNKGTVRRAARDVEEGKVALVSLEGEAATVSADGETVKIGAAGPAKATCSCPAPGICRHRIAAVLFLQADAGGGTAPEPAADDPEVATRLLAEVADISEAKLRRHAGKAGWAAALELAAGGAEIAAEGTGLRIRLATEDLDVRYLPGLGIEGMVSKAAAGKRKALHVAALIAARRQAGVEPAEPVVTEAPAETDAATTDAAFLAEIRAGLAEAARSALSFAPLSLEERLFTLSVSSRADASPRLGAMLRGIARMMRERRSRSFTFDPDACLGEIATADALARALGMVADPVRHAALQGRIRQAYEETGPLDLRGMGAEVWHAPGGARGVTVHLYSREHDRWFTGAVARGMGQDPNFIPDAAYFQEMLWGGHHFADLACGNVLFQKVAASETGRLSTASGIVAQVSAAPVMIPSDWPCVMTSWDELEARVRDRLTGTLSAPAPLMEPVVLRPARAAKPWFDDLAQTLVCPVQDEVGRWLALSLRHDPAETHRADALAAFLGGRKAVTIVAAADIADGVYRLRPIALADDKIFWSVNTGHFPVPPKTGFFTESLRALFSRGPTVLVRQPKRASDRLLDDIRNELTGLAETGCRLVTEAGAARLGSMESRAGGAGFTAVAATLRAVRAADPAGLAAAVLSACFVVDAVRRQLTQLPLLTPTG